MKSTGIVRKIDELGRIVIPKELRKTLNIKDSDELEIYIEEDNIILKKHYRLLALKDLASDYLELFSKLYSSNIYITDREKILISSKNCAENLNNLFISKVVDDAISGRKKVEGINLNIENVVLKGKYIINPILCNTDLVGSIICVNEKEISGSDKLIVEVINSLLCLKIRN